MSKTLKRPMFRMGGDTNSGIMSGFEREKFQSGTGGDQSVPGGESVKIQDVPSQIAFPRVTVDESQSLADLINMQRTTATPAATPSMSMQEKFGQMVGPVPDEFQRGFGLSEYLALVKLGAGIAGAPNQGKGFKNFVRSAAPAVSQFAEDIGALDRAKTVKRQEIDKQRTEAEQKGAELDVTIGLSTQELLNQRQIAQLNALTDLGIARENRENAAIILQDSLLLSEVIRGHPPESAIHKEALNRYKKLNEQKTNQRDKLKAELAGNQAFLFQAQTDVTDATKNPEGLSLEAYVAKKVNEQVDELFPEEEQMQLPEYEEGYKTPQKTLDWFKGGAKTEFTLPDITKAEGGRVGFQQGGTRAAGDITGMAPGMTGTTEGTASPISFEELRARLPQEVSNEVVRLLASSEAALIDFAQIQTQDDISRFNQKYNTDLQLPAQQAV
jgi:hypothetical protein